MLQDAVNSFHSLDDSFGKTALEDTVGLPVICGICEKPFKDPVILTCLHIFDRECLLSFEEHGEVTYVKCPRCNGLSESLNTLEAFDPSIAEEPQEQQSNGAVVQCSVCTEGLEALYRCIHCAGTLCERCREIHKVMKCFSRHEVLDLTEEEKKDIAILQRNIQNTKPVPCQTHPETFYTSFCVQCHVPLCEICYESEHKAHITSGLDLIPDHVGSLLSGLFEACADKQQDLKQLSDNLHSFLSDLSTSRDRSKVAINEAYTRWKTILDSIRDGFLQRNREIHDSIEMKLWSRIHSIGKTLDHIDFACEFSKSYLRKCSNIDMCKLTKSVLACLDRLSKSNYSTEPPTKISFVPAMLNVANLNNQFGTFDYPNATCQRPDELFKSFCRSPHIGNTNTSGDIAEELKCVSLKEGTNDSTILPPDGASISQLSSVSPTESQGSSRALSAVGNLQLTNGFDGFISRSNEQCHVLTRPITSWNDLNVGGKVIEQQDYISNVNPIDTTFLGSPFMGPNMMRHINTGVVPPSPEMDYPALKQKLPVNYNATLFEYCRLRSARCSQMNLLTKWGSLGCELGRLSSPHGFCLGFDEEIVVADTYNHRIQIFTKNGDYVSYFGVSGRVDGLLWYPRKVAIIRQSQRYVVCDRGNERSRMQLFSRSGHFVRRIPIRYIDIVAGLAINQHGHIVAIDSVSPSVFVVAEEGELIRWFDCSNYMREPSDVAIHGREYYICDFKANCVIVFQDDGTFLRRIGGESITDFPNGIDVSDHGDVLVGDSHGNRFHIAVFSRTGDLLSEFVFNQTKVSRSCCLKITTEGYVVTLARSSNNVLVMDTLYIC